MSKNDITGDTIKTKWSGNFAPGWDAIWGTKVKVDTPAALNVANLKDRLSFLDQEAFSYDKVTNAALGAPGVCPPPAKVFVWLNDRGACEIRDLYFDPELGIIIDLMES